MYRVTWNDPKDALRHHELRVSDETDARSLFAIVVRACVKGEATDALLIHNGRCVDSWGT